MIRSVFLLFCLFTLPFFMATASDTLRIRSHNKEHWSWYGSIDKPTVLPPDSIGFKKITLKYTLGCPSAGCSDWDYTTSIKLLQRSGKWDTTVTQYPNYTVQGVVTSPFYFNTQPVYVTSYNATTNQTDSTVAITKQVVLFKDTLHPATATDTLWVFGGNYYNYYYNSSGQKIDSIWVSADSLWTVTYFTTRTPYEKLNEIELARYITPYGGNLNSSFSRTYEFDVTDLAPVLHDSVMIRAFYSGWSDGFTITVDFDFIKGTPPRKALSVKQLWQGDYTYGDASNPIDNAIKAYRLKKGANSITQQLRFTPTGHGFNNTQDCAEFCPKNYYVKINGSNLYTQAIWRDNCGLNPFFPQPGTWLYNRANWCPGAMVKTFQHDLTNALTAVSDSFNLDVDFQAYTNLEPGSPASYTINAQYVEFGPPNFTNNAELVSIVSPNNQYEFRRSNPVCANPVIRIRNLGQNPLNSLQIKYGIGDTSQTYQWTGSLSFLETTEVELPGGLSLFTNNTSTEFKVVILLPNMQADEDPEDNAASSSFARVPDFPYLTYILWLTTNLAANETSYELLDEKNQVIHSRQNLNNQTVYKDTLTLTPGCYHIRLTDSDCDGLSFWANDDAGGVLRLYRLGKTAPAYTFPTDFGCEANYNFTASMPTGIETAEIEQMIGLTPNPASTNITLQSDLFTTELPCRITITDGLGRISMQDEQKTNGGKIQINTSGLVNGFYTISLHIAHTSIHKSFVIQQ